MPIFEYSCTRCGVRYEKIVFNRSAPAPPCPKCGSGEVTKLISAPGSVGVPSSAASAAPACPSTGAKCGSGFA